MPTMKDFAKRVLASAFESLEQKPVMLVDSFKAHMTNVEFAVQKTGTGLDFIPGGMTSH